MVKHLILLLFLGVLTARAGGPPPVIVVQPLSLSVPILGTASFSVVASSGTTMTYQWSKGGLSIAGATSSVLSFSSALCSDAGDYSVTIVNAGGSVTSSNATLTLVAPPCVAFQPASQTATQGQTISFSVAASGSSPFTYQWCFNGSPLAGKTSSTFALTNVQSGSAGSYSAIVSNPFGSSTSSGATLVVYLPPSITTQPQSQSVTQYQTVSLNVVATGSGPATYQWYLNGVSLGTSGQNAQYSRTSVGTNNAGNYQVVVKNNYGSATSSVATLTVLVRPTIATQPQNQTVGVSQSATFSVVPSGTSPFSYQWKFNGNLISGATNSAFTLTNVQLTNGGLYSVSVLNSIGSANSTSATLKVLPGLVSTVLNTNDSGTGSLRQALLDVNSASSLHFIVFNIPGNPPFQIAPATALPVASNSVVIDATDQPGYAGQPLLELNGNNLLSEGFHLSGGNSAVRGFVINRFTSAGIIMDTAGSNIVEGNFIGSDVTGMLSLGNGTGISIAAGAHFSQIGGTNTGSGNLISGNTGYGMFINGGASNVIQGNLFGVNVKGTSVLSNSSVAIKIQNSAGTLIGGTSSAAGNVISGNGAEGIKGFGANTPYLAIQGNFIGTDRSGTLRLGNANSGIFLGGSAAQMLIGGTQNEAGNVIAFNAKGGITVTTGQTAIEGNSIFGNGTNEIANSLYYYPVLTGATNNLEKTVIAGKLIGVGAIQTCRIEFFANPSCESSGFGAGTTYLGAAYVTTDASGNAVFQVTLDTDDISGQVVTATTTTPDSRTSTFSACQPVVLMTPPSIVTQPDSQTVNLGTNVSISVTATGSGTLSYQWSMNGTNLPGATSSVLNLSNIQSAQAGSYAVTVSSAWGWTRSVAATLMLVSPAPSAPMVLAASGSSVMTPAGFAFQISVPVGSTFVIEASSDMRQWIPIATNVATSATAAFTDAAAANFPARYYRARTP